jgi:glyoxylase-like metal-dependent hydrolase (beta-lactamase superfamily II)
MRDRVFTGDTLLIRGTGRTDFQNGSARAQYESLFGKLLKLPEETLVYPPTTTRATRSPPSARRSATTRACR